MPRGRRCRPSAGSACTAETRRPLPLPSSRRTSCWCATAAARRSPAGNRRRSCAHRRRTCRPRRRRGSRAPPSTASKSNIVYLLRISGEPKMEERRSCSIRCLLSNSGGLARQRLDHRKPTFGQAAYRVDPPFLGILARHDVLAQRRKSLCFQLLQDRSQCRSARRYHEERRSENRLPSKSPRSSSWRGEETDVWRGGPRQRVAGFSR